MLSSIFIGDHLDLSFRAGAGIVVTIAERPGTWMAPDKLARLVDDCRSVAASGLGGETLDYGIFANDRQALDHTVITLVRDRATGAPIAFNALPLLPVEIGGQSTDVLHLGLVMIHPDARSRGLSWILYGLTCFLLFFRRQMRSLWVSSVTQVPAVVGMVAETFDAVYPAQGRLAPTFAHAHIARQIMRDHRSAFGVGADARFDAASFVIADAYTGGSDHLKKTFDVATKHRQERYNDFCRDALDYCRGDDVLQLGQLNLATARRYFTQSVPRASLPGLLVQPLFVGVQAIAAPAAQWLAADRPLGRLRPTR